MNRLILIVLLIFVAVVSCKTQKNLQTAPVQDPEQITEPTKEVIEEVEEEPIVEKEEVIVEETGPVPDQNDYFVIIGSFRVQPNAVKHQNAIKKDGFETSELLLNEEGLYRVSVMGSKDILDCRKEILRIRTQFPEYFDTWLLIRKK